LNPEWALKISPSLWTIGTEVQLYLLFCLVLVPIWRKLGMLATLVAGFAVGFVPGVILGNPGGVPSPFYPALFALGMGAAMVARSNGALEKTLRERASWSGICTILCLITALMNVLNLEDPRGSRSFSNVAVGCALAAFLIHGATAARRDSLGRESAILRILRSRFAAMLGLISYSLYVVHEPILRAMHLYLERAGTSPLEAFILLLVVGVPTCLGGALLMHHGVERRFRPRALTANRKVEPPAPQRLPVPQ
jgi:peptidoglycan/LPS O-acetylase OafA/YrhL